MNELLRKYLNSVKMFEAPNDQGSNNDPEKVAADAAAKAAEQRQKDRDAIKVDSFSNKDKENNEDEEEEEPEGEEEDDEEDEEENETEDEKKERLAKEKEDRKNARIQKRIDRLTAENGNKDAEIERLRKQLEEKPVEGLTEEEVERRAAIKAEELAKQKEIESDQRRFNKDSNKLFNDAVKVDKEFKTKIDEVAEDAGLIPAQMVVVLADLDNENGGEVLAHLANDPDEYEVIINLSPAKMSQRIIRLSDKLKSEKKSATPRRERSNAPPPIEPVDDGHRNRGNILPKDPTKNMEEYVRIRNIQARKFREDKYNR